jgi:hypothetical protein
MWRVFLLFAVLLLVPAAGVVASVIVTVDQQNLVSDTSSGPGIVTGRYFGQSFTPTLTGIDAVELLMVTSGSSSTVFIELLAGSGTVGAAIASTGSVTIINTTFEMVHFDFPSTVPLIPSSTYTFAFNYASGDAPLHQYSSLNPYAGGMAFDEGNLSRPEYDFVFSEGLHGVIPEPSTLVIWSLLGICGIGIGWRRRRKA